MNYMHDKMTESERNMERVMSTESQGDSDADIIRKELVKAEVALQADL